MSDLPRIDLIVSRDPDAADEVLLYLDGQLVTDYHLHYLDPGAGHLRSDWEQARAEDLDDVDPVAHPRLHAALVACWDAAGQSKYVSDNDEHYTY